MTLLNKSKKLAEQSKKKSKPQFSEKGRNGVQFFAGLISGEEYLNNLTGSKGLEVYDRMRRSDGQVRGTLFAITLPIRQANFYIESATDDKKDIEIAETIEKNLFEEMTITWDDFLRQVLNYLVFGYSIFEKVWMYQDNLIKLKKLAPRIQKSLYKWKQDKHGGLAGIIQYAQDADGNFNYYPIDVKKLLLFVNEQEGANFEGISVLRSAYKHWFIKDELYKVDAIGHDRFASGVPYAKEPENPNEQDKIRVETILENLYSREKSWMRIPNGWELGILEKSGNNSSIINSIKHHNEEISKNILTQFINLGTSNSGSRALGDSFEELFLLAINAIAEYIEDNINRYVIKQYVDYNWNVKEYPKLKHGKIILDVSKWLEGISKIGGSTILHSDPEIENHVRETLGFPCLKKEDIEAQQDMKQSMINNFNKNDNENKSKDQNITEKEKDQGEDQQPEEEKLHYHNQFIQLREYQRRRQLRDYEEVLADFDAIELALNTGSEKYESQVLRVRKQQAEQLTKDVIKKNPEKLQVSYIGKMADRIFDEMKRMYRKGKSHVQDELERQKKQASKKFAYDDFLTDFDPFSRKDIVEYLKKKSMSDAVIMSESLKKEALYLMYTQGIGMTDKELEKHIYSGLLAKGVSDIKKTAESTINRAYNLGRTQAADQYKKDIEYGVYSALLDSRACESCLPKDGVKHALDDEAFMTPNPECLGGDLCRCVTIYKLREMEGDFYYKTREQYQEDLREINKIKNIDTKAPNYKWGTKTEMKNEYMDNQRKKYEV